MSLWTMVPSRAELLQVHHGNLFLHVYAGLGFCRAAFTTIKRAPMVAATSNQSGDLRR